jgi:DNA helicase II / ATP-dependent DNA helicase PcrA
MAISQNLDVQQKDAVVTTEGPLLIIAGPGSGKTFTIANSLKYHPTS